MTRPFQITILGSGTAVPREDRGSPGYLVEIGDHNILMDPGSGALRQLHATGTALNDIDRIVVTHTHPDHTLDVMSFLFASRFKGMERRRDLEFICPPGFPDMYDDMLSLYEGHLTSDHYEVHFETVEDVLLDFDGWQLDVYPTIHMQGSFCTLFIREKGGRIFYSSDTAYAQTVATAARDADVALVECSLPDEEEPENHMTPRWVGKLADVADPGVLVTTHMYPPVLEEDIEGQIAEYWEGPVRIGEDLATYSVFETYSE